MMTIEMRTLARGAFNADPGQLIDLPRNQAVELIAAGYAKAVGNGSEDNANDDAAPTANKRPKGAPKRK